MQRYGLVGDVTLVPYAEAALSVPSPAKGCLSKRKMTVTVWSVGRGRLRSFKVTVNGKRIKARRAGRKKVTFSLAGRRAGRYTVKVTGVTAHGRRVSTTRRYRTCIPGTRGPVKTS